MKNAGEKLEQQIASQEMTKLWQFHSEWQGSGSRASPQTTHNQN
jgi:hypothetical protein